MLKIESLLCSYGGINSLNVTDSPFNHRRLCALVSSAICLSANKLRLRHTEGLHRYLRRQIGLKVYQWVSLKYERCAITIRTRHCCAHRSYVSSCQQVFKVQKRSSLLWRCLILDLHRLEKCNFTEHKYDRGTWCDLTCCEKEGKRCQIHPSAALLTVHSTKRSPASLKRWNSFSFVVVHNLTG